MSTKDNGFTLVELMVTLAVAIVLIAVGIPLFSGVAANNRATTQVNTLVTAINLARSEAVNRGTAVSLCSAGDTSTTPPCGSDTDWKNGWFAFVDGGTPGTFDSSTDEYLRIWQVSDPNATISSIGADFIGFDYNGAAGTTVNLSVDNSAASVNVARCITVTGSGQIRTHKYDSSSETCP